MDSILITGATGFIGQHLLEDMANSPLSIRIITRDLNKKIRALPVGAQIFKADLNDYSSMLQACEGIQTIINIAAEVRNYGLINKTNIEGTQNLINAAVTNNVKKIIHISSVGVVGANYQNRSLIVDEETTCNPENSYEKSKLSSENILLDAQSKHHFDLDIIRPTNVLGEHHSFNALLHLMKHMQVSKPVVYTKDAYVNYIYVKDLTALIIQLIGKNTSNGIINIGRSMELKFFYKLIKELLDSKSSVIRIPQLIPVFIGALGVHRLAPISSGVQYSDSKLSGFFSYPYGIREGIARTIDFYKQEKLL